MNFIGKYLFGETFCQGNGHLGKYLVENMVIWGTARSVKCKIGELPDQRNVWSENCLVGKMSVGELPVGELGGQGTVSWGTFRES